MDGQKKSAILIKSKFTKELLEGQFEFYQTMFPTHVCVSGQTAVIS